MRPGPLRWIRPTAHGVVFGLVLLAVLGAALNTGNNLLYLILAAMLSLVAMSGVLSELAIQQLEIEIFVRERLYVGRAARLHWRIRSGHRLLPHLALRLDPHPGQHAILREAAPVLLPFLPAAGSAWLASSVVFDRRGVHRLAGIQVSTVFPFGIFRKSYRIDRPLELLVYPAVGPVALPEQPGATEGEGRDQPRRSGDGALKELREHRLGEDLRLVHWRISARRGRTIAVEREAEGRDPVEVVLWAPSGGDEGQRLSRFDEAVSRAASEVEVAFAAGHPVHLRGPGGDLPLATGDRGRDRLLRYLALSELPRAGS